MIRYIPGWPAVLTAFTITSGACLAVLAATAGVVAGTSRMKVSFAVLLVAALLATVGFRWFRDMQKVRRAIPAGLLHQRHHGDLAVATSDRHRPLRPIGCTRADVVWRTDILLDTLTRVPGVRIFRGVRLPGSPSAVAAHAVAAGRRLILMEPVCWPPGRYRLGDDHTVCFSSEGDDQPIGQSAGQLVAAAATLRRLLPWRHRVTAMVVVHRDGHGIYHLPADDRDVSWVLADDLPRLLDATLAKHGRLVSRHTIVTLLRRSV